MSESASEKVRAHCERVLREHQERDTDERHQVDICVFCGYDWPCDARVGALMLLEVCDSNTLKPPFEAMASHLGASQEEGE